MKKMAATFALVALMPVSGLLGGCQKWAHVPDGWHNHDDDWLGRAELSQDGVHADHGVRTPHVHLRDAGIHPDHFLYLNGDVRKPVGSGIENVGDPFTERDVYPSRYGADGQRLPRDQWPDHSPE